MFDELFLLMGKMFLLIVTGFTARKINLITDEGKKCLTDLILYVILPANIIKAFSLEIESGVWVSFLGVLAISVMIELIALMIARTMYQKMSLGERQVYQYGSVCSNSGLIGNSLAEGIFGNIGLLYASAFLIPQRVVMWTAGVSYFQKGGDKRDVYKKILKHPCMVASYIGIIMMTTQIHLPGVLASTVESLSNCCTGMTMMYIGTILVGVNVRALLNKNQFYYAFIRLIGIPLCAYLACRLVHMDPLVTGVSTLLSAAPAGSTTSLLAAKYGADEEAAAKAVVFTTALSVVTIPVWSMILLSQL